MATAYKNGKSWIAEEWLGGKKDGQRFRRRGATRKEALNRVALAIADTERKASNATVGDLLAHYRVNRLPYKSNRERFEYRLAHIAELADRDARSVAFTDVQRWLNTKNLSRSELAKLRGLLSEVYRLGMASGMVDRDPTIEAELPKHTKPPRETKVMDLEETRRFLKAAESEPLYPLFYFVLFVGARPGEAYALTWEQVDLDAGTVTLRNTKAKRVSDFRILPLANNVRQVLEALPHREGLVFHSEKGTRLDRHNVLRTLRRIAKCAEVDTSLTVYSLRHGHAQLTSQIAKLQEVRDQLGHRDFGQLSRFYLNHPDQVKKGTGDALERLLREERQSDS